MRGPEVLVRELLPLLRGWCIGPYAIALGGSYAKGSSDAHSDVDVYLFAREVIPRVARNQNVSQALGVEPASWGQDEPFIQAGTDFTYRGQSVECWLRNTEQVETSLAASMEGEMHRQYVVWTAMGFFNYVALADVHAMHVVEDPSGLLQTWKKRVSVYPEKLREAILGKFIPEAAFWPRNPHYDRAVEREDVIYTSAIVQQVVQALVQVLFALNYEYFPGEKKLTLALNKLRIQPEAFSARTEALLFPGSTPGRSQLRKQQQELAALVADVEQIAASSTSTHP
jgi:hypothetical protein